MSNFMRKGITKAHFVLIVTNKAAMTVAELTAGTLLNPKLAEVNGFTFANSPIQVPDFDNTFTSQIGGEDTAADSNLGFYEDDVANPIRTVLAKGTVGFVVFFPTGYAGASPAAADKYEIWPSIVTSNSRAYTAGNEAAMYTANFAITAPPSEGSLAA